MRQDIGKASEHMAYLVVQTQPQQTFVRGTLIHAIRLTKGDNKNPLQTNEKVWYVNTKKPGPEISFKVAELTETESREAMAKLKAVRLTKAPTEVGGNCVDYIRLGAEALVAAGLMQKNTKLDELTDPQGAEYKRIRKVVWGQS